MSALEGLQVLRLAQLAVHATGPRLRAIRVSTHFVGFRHSLGIQWCSDTVVFT